MAEATMTDSEDMGVAGFRAMKMFFDLMNPPLVYFIGIPGGQRVKIGTTRNLEKRLASLQTGSPVDLVALAVVPGGREEEAEFHRRFAKYRTRGEWFMMSQDIVDFINSLPREP